MRARLLILSLVALLAICVPFTTQAAAGTTFTAHLSAGQEVQTPAVVSNAQGQAIFHLNAEGTELRYKLIVANIDDVMFAHIHTAVAGANGPVVAFLFHGPTISGRTQGVLAEGTITASDLVGPLAGHSLSDLVSALESGGAYANAHTTAYPAGEIRGQIK
ncbi:MAG: CHRD domain-containing protein [Chloroflexi bacterium]|nr:MAG: CHRD domain-containing protein [Chloroflexota bacterium]